METFWLDLRHAARMLTRSPGFAAVAVLTLALGIGATTAIFSVVNGVLLRPLPYEEPGRLVTLREVSREGNQMNVPEQNFLDWQQAARSYERMAFYNSFEESVAGGREPVRALVSEISDGFFDVLRVEPFRGRFPSGASPAVVVSYEFWRDFLGEVPDLEGKEVRAGGYAFPVVGVTPPGFAFPAQVAVWVPKSVFGPPNPSRSAHNWRVIARLKPDATIPSARAELSGIARRIHEGYTDVTAVDATLLPLAGALTARIRPALLLLAGAVALLLLIACANVMNLLLARATAREKEFAVRGALGASRPRLVRQCVTESLMLATLAALAGGMLAAWGVDALLALGRGQIPRAGDVRMDPVVLGFTLVLSLLTSVVLGLVPGLRAGSMQLQPAMNEGGRSGSSGKGHKRIRSALVVSQIALTLVLLVGAGLLARSFARVMEVELGFQRENRLEIDVQRSFAHGEPEAGRLREFAGRLEETIAAMPGVLSVGGSSAPPLSPYGGNGRFQIEGRGHSGTYWPNYRIASPGYFRTLGIPLLRGRVFDDNDGTDTPHVAVISREVAEKAFPGEDPIGRRINTSNMDSDETWMTIVGVVADVRDFGPEADAGGAIYAHYLQRGHGSGLGQFTWVLHTASDPAALIPPIRKAIRALDPEAAPKFATLEQGFSAATAPRRFNLTLIGVFAGVALLLAGLGIYGVQAYSVEQRTREIGIRMALGARAGEVGRMIVGEGLRLAALGVTIGLAGAFALTRLLENLLFGVKPTDPLTYAGTITFLVMLTVLAGWIPARRAMHVEPMGSLRRE